MDDGPERAFEPDAAVDPNDPDHWIIGSTVFHEDAEMGTPLYLTVHVTFDAGRTWTGGRFPGDVAPDHALVAYTHSADPAVVILDDGSALYAGMAATGVLHPPGATGLALFRPFDVFVARSTDGGLTWPEAAIVVRGTGMMGVGPPQGLFVAGTWPDHPWLAAGPDGRVLLTWQLREAEGGPQTFTAYASISRDGGRSWSPPVPIDERFDSGTARPSVAPAGTFWLSYQDQSKDPRDVWIASSRDGREWARRLVPDVATSWFHDFDASGVALGLVYVPADVDGMETVRLLRSADGGLTWSAWDLDRSEAPGHTMPRVVVRGTAALATYYYPLAGGGSEYRAALVSTDGVVSRAVLSVAPIGESEIVGRGGWPKFGDYVGLGAGPTGAVASWVSADIPDTDLQAAWVPWPGAGDM
ncbi:MAG: hypothetical protein ACT4PT_08025 [Methanobacteriota archaeon]